MEPESDAPWHEPATSVYVPLGNVPLIGVAGVTSAQVKPLVSTATPAGGLTAPAKLGDPPLVWLPLTAMVSGYGLTLTDPPT